MTFAPNPLMLAFKKSSLESIAGDPLDKIISLMFTQFPSLLLFPLVFCLPIPLTLNIHSPECWEWATRSSKMFVCHQPANFGPKCPPKKRVIATKLNSRQKCKIKYRLCLCEPWSEITHLNHSSLFEEAHFIQTHCLNGPHLSNSTVLWGIFCLWISVVVTVVLSDLLLTSCSSWSLLSILTSGGTITVSSVFSRRAMATRQWCLPAQIRASAAWAGLQLWCSTSLNLWKISWKKTPRLWTSSLAWLGICYSSPISRQSSLSIQVIEPLFA